MRLLHVGFPDFSTTVAKNFREQVHESVQRISGLIQMAESTPGPSGGEPTRVSSIAFTGGHAESVEKEALFLRALERQLQRNDAEAISPRPRSILVPAEHLTNDPQAEPYRRTVDLNEGSASFYVRPTAYATFVAAYRDTPIDAEALERALQRVTRKLIDFCHFTPTILIAPDDPYRRARQARFSSRHEGIDVVLCSGSEPAAMLRPVGHEVSVWTLTVDERGASLLDFPEPALDPACRRSITVRSKRVFLGQFGPPHRIELAGLEERFEHSDGLVAPEPSLPEGYPAHRFPMLVEAWRQCRSLVDAAGDWRIKAVVYPDGSYWPDLFGFLPASELELDLLRRKPQLRNDLAELGATVCVVEAKDLFAAGPGFQERVFRLTARMRSARGRSTQRPPVFVVPDFGEYEMQILKANQSGSSGTWQQLYAPWRQAMDQSDVRFIFMYRRSHHESLKTEWPKEGANSWRLKREGIFNGTQLPVHTATDVRNLLWWYRRHVPMPQEPAVRAELIQPETAHALFEAVLEKLRAWLDQSPQEGDARDRRLEDIDVLVGQMNGFLLEVLDEWAADEHSRSVRRWQREVLYVREYCEVEMLKLHPNVSREHVSAIFRKIAQCASPGVLAQQQDGFWGRILVTLDDFAPEPVEATRAVLQVLCDVGYLEKIDGRGFQILKPLCFVCASLDETSRSRQEPEVFKTPALAS